MGKSDKLFHQRKARNAADVKRNQAKRSPYDRVLIVCEGEKTEPDYFKALVDDLQLNTANIRIAENTSGSSPRNVVDLAIDEYKKDKKVGREIGEQYDRVYCVFDKDKHTTYSAALDIIFRQQEIGKRGCPIYPITSVPCFEFWLLLHFRYTTKDFDSGHGSICDNVIKHLNQDIKHLNQDIPSYKKGGMREIYQIVKNRIATAVKNAKKIEEHCRKIGTDMPSTKVYELVEYLQQLKMKK